MSNQSCKGPVLPINEKSKQQVINELEKLHRLAPHVGTRCDGAGSEDAQVAEFGRILECSFNEICVINANTFKFVMANRGIRENLGYSMEELRNQTLPNILAGYTPSTFEKLIEPLRTGKEKRTSFEAEYKRGDGSLCPVEIHLEFSSFESSPAFVAVILDNTKRKELDAEVDRLRVAFLDSISHEIRTPLTSIKGMASSLVQPDVEWDDSTQEDFLTAIDEESDHLLRVFNDIVDMAKITGGALNLNCQPAYLGSIIEHLSVTLNNLTADHELDLRIPDDLPSTLADMIRISQVITYLVENAVFHSPFGSSIVLEVRALEDQLLIVVTDQGNGIPRNQRKSIFDHFYRLEENTQRRRRGSCLELAICRGIVEAHGGQIWVESQLGKGSALSFSLPVVQVADQI